MLEVYGKTILWLKSVQLLHLWGCVEHPQGQAYKLAAALCTWPWDRSFSWYWSDSASSFRRWEKMLGYIQSPLDSSCLGRQTPWSQCRADKTISSFLQLLCHHSSRELLARSAWAWGSQCLLLFPSQPIRPWAGNGTTAGRVSPPKFLV